MCDEPFLCADATELPNHPAPRRALKFTRRFRPSTVPWEPRLFCIGGLLSGYCFSEIAVYFLANVGYNAGDVWRLCFV